MKRIMLLVFALALTLLTAFAQSRSDLTRRFGPPQTESFLVRPTIKLSATYDLNEHVCTLRLETPDHNQRVAPNLSDARYWMDTDQVTRLIAELVPQEQRHGPVQHSTVGLRVGEYTLIESDDAVQITRIQRSRSLSSQLPVADRLVTVNWKRPECLAAVATK